jgi:hypothetical protein
MTTGTSYEIERSKMLFDKISTFDFGKVVTKYSNDHKVSFDAANEVLIELKRWLTLCVLHPEKPYAPGVEVDQMWHIFILFTRDYARFCQDTAGCFIHHQPDVASDDLEMRKIAADKRAEITKILTADYLKYFGGPPPAHIWGMQLRAKALENAFRFLQEMARKDQEPGSEIQSPMKQ